MAEAHGEPPPQPAVTPREPADGLVALCGLAWAAGTIHLVAALGHTAEHPSHGAFLACLGLAQLAWGVALQHAPTRRMLVAGATASLAVVALWTLTRTSGLPLGPGRWTPEPVGLLDSLATADEVALALLAGLHIRFAPAMPLRRCVEALALFIVLLSAVSLAHLGHGD